MEDEFRGSGIYTLSNYELQYIEDEKIDILSKMFPLSRTLKKRERLNKGF